MTDTGRLPDSYDQLVAKEQLSHGTHNVRRVKPSHQLTRSIEKDGLTDPLVVRPSDDGSYQITDGWQRYQAAISLGWDQLPVNVYHKTLAALEAAEASSIVTEWTTYQTARHVESLYTELATDAATLDQATMRQVATRTPRTYETVKRYLHALSIPQDLQPLLKQRQNITEQEWQAVENYDPDVRRYDGLSWKVAAKAGQHTDSLAGDRCRRVLLETLGYDVPTGRRLVKEAVENPDSTIDMLTYRFDERGTRERWLRVPQLGLRIEEGKKEAVMDYCHNRKVHLSDIVEKQVREFADKVASEETTSD